MAEHWYGTCRRVQIGPQGYHILHYPGCDHRWWLKPGDSL